MAHQIGLKMDTLELIVFCSIDDSNSTCRKMFFDTLTSRGLCSSLNMSPLRTLVDKSESATLDYLDRSFNTRKEHDNQLLFLKENRFCKTFF